MKLGKFGYLFDSDFPEAVQTYLSGGTLIGLMLINILLWGQPSLIPQDTLLASSFFTQADSLQQIGESEKAIPLFEEAAQLYALGGANDRSAMAFNTYLSLMIGQRNPKVPQLVDRLTTLIPTWKEKYPPNHYIILQALENLGHHENKEVNYEKSRRYYKELFRWGDSLGFPSKTLFINSSIHYSNTLVNLNEFQKAYELLRKAESMLEEQDEKYRRALYNAFAIFYVNRNQNVYAKIYFEKSLEEQTKRKLNIHENNGKLFLNLAAITKELYELEKSKQYGEEALRLITKQYGEKHLYTAYVYNNLGNTLRLLKEYERSEACQMKSMEIRLALYGEMHVLVADPLQNLGNLYLDMGKYEEAITYAKRAIALWVRHGGDSHATVIRLYNQLSICYERLEDYPESLASIEKALETVRQNPDSPIEFYASSLGQKGKILRLLGQQQLALDFIQQAIIQIHDQFKERDWRINPPLPGNQNERFLRGFLADKGLCLYDLYRQNKELPLLKQAADCFQLASQAADSMRARNKDEEDLHYTSRRSREMYQSGIEILVELYHTTQEKQYLNRAFLYAEKSKSATLEVALQDAKARKTAGLPEAWRERELKVRSDMDFEKGQVNLWRENQDSLRLTESQERFFHLKNQYDSLLAYFELAFPAYYALRFKPVTLDLVETQASLPANTSMLSFATGKRSLYAFVVSREKAEVFSLSWAESQQAALKEFIQGLRDPARALQEENDPAAIAAFETNAHAFYQQLLAPLHIDSQQSLWIVPDGILGYLPFEVLITQKLKQPASSFRELAYFFQTQKLRYAFSATIALGEHKEKEASAGGKYIGFAPVYSDDIAISDAIKRGNTERISRNAFANLHANQPEIEAAAYIWSGKAILGKKATERSFKTFASQYDMLHLAMHAFTNDQQPAYSGLIFASETDSVEDQILYAYEIGNLNLHVELAVLSACNTGTGSIAQGEGVMSLARAFRYAGCRNLLTSLWQAEDQATAQIIGDFFRELKQQQPKDEAIRKARLSYLEKGRHPHPFFWAPFILIGDDLPVQNHKNFPFWILFPLALITIIGIIFIKNKKR